MYFYAARQPILTKDKKVFGYELLFRDGLDNVFPQIDDESATTKMVEASQFNVGLHGFTDHKPAFINFTLDTLLDGYPEIINPQEVVIEILETVRPGKKLLAKCTELKEQGYTLALDDYIHQKVWAHFYPIIDIIKIDLRCTSFEQIEEIKLAILDHPHIKLLAEKVETYEEFNKAVEAGFEYFQGYFFAKPEVVQTKDLSPSQMTLAELLYETSKSEMDLAKITEVFSRDITLSYKILRYANSAIFRRRSEISSIKQAVVLLGAKELKRFLALMFATNANPDKPVELIRLSMIRAKFCELVADEDNKGVSTDIAFLTGLMSLLDAILDEELSVILEKLPLAPEISTALVDNKGRLALYLQIVKQIELGAWKKVAKLNELLNAKHEEVIEVYNNAVSWAAEQIEITCSSG
jgi:EAL and modified HD-GYP domain-containing signal transduction protein